MVSGIPSTWDVCPTATSHIAFIKEFVVSLKLGDGLLKDGAPECAISTFSTHDRIPISCHILACIEQQVVIDSDGDRDTHGKQVDGVDSSRVLFLDLEDLLDSLRVGSDGRNARL